MRKYPKVDIVTYLDADIYFFASPEFLIKYRIHESQTAKQTQLNSANEVRKIMLQNIGCTLENKDLNIFFDLAINKKVNINDAERIFKYLKRSNAKSKVIERKSLDKLLGCKFWQVLNNQPQYTLSIYFQYCQSPLRKYINCTFLGYLKFLTKCLLRYSNGK